MTKQWSTQFGFITASIGFAVGLGNIWRFPYVTGENGGAVFVLVYLACVLLIGVPILMAELMLGRRGRGSPVSAMAQVAQSESRSRQWRHLGSLNLITAFGIQFVYCVIAGWVLYYLYFTVTSGFSGLDVVGSNEVFANLLSDTTGLIFWTALGLLVTAAIIYFGVQSGIEPVVRVLLPLLFVLLVVLALVNAANSNFGEAIAYLFTPDFSKFNASLVLAAVGQAFFSIGVAMAGMMVYGAYLPKSVSISKSVFVIVFADTLVALLAGLVVFPLVFQYGLDPGSGVGLIFQTLPVAFAQWPMGDLFAAAFFVLLAVAAITSMVGFMEPLVAYGESELGFSRELSVVLVTALVWVCAMLSIVAYGEWAGVTVFARSLNDWFDFIPNQILLPIGGFLIAVFAGWRVSQATARSELAMQRRMGFFLWRVLIRYLVPPVILTILITGLW